MDHQGHGLALDHPIFTTPKRAEFEWREAPRPKNYERNTSPLYPQGMPETYRLAAFEVDQPKGEWNPTLVAHEGFFTDVPGFENIAEGNSAKILGSLSLARQGRWFYWGYSIDPQRTTAGAKTTFVNVLHYMRQHRDSLTVEFVCKTRRILWIYLELNRESGYLRGIEEHLPGQLTAAAKQDYVATVDGCTQWLDRYLPYVFSGKGEEHRDKRYGTVFDVDRDALALGTPNAERASLERWIELAHGPAGEDRDLALRCLSRYVHPEIAPEDGDWRRFYTEQRDRIVFVESTGFWWQVDPRVLERERAAAVRPR